jgi:hypothetical protein
MRDELTPELKAKLLHPWQPATHPGAWGLELPSAECPICVLSYKGEKTAYLQKDERRVHGYYICYGPTDRYLGPFPDLESALIAADTMHTLKEYPR